MVKNFWVVTKLVTYMIFFNKNFNLFQFRIYDYYIVLNFENLNYYTVWLKNLKDVKKMNI